MTTISKGLPRHWPLRLALVGLIPSAALAAQFPPPPLTTDGVSAEVVARGLHDPRGMVFAADGSLYVAEAGGTQGVFVPPPPPPPTEPPIKTRCEVYWPVGPATGGFTGRISRIDLSTHEVTQVVRGLPSTAANALIGGDRQSVGAVAFLNGKLYGVFGGAGCSHGHPSDDNDVFRVVLTTATTVPVADLSNYLRTTPDSKDPAAPDYEPDGTWTNLVKSDGALYAVEPNRGVFVRIARDGAITPVVDMIAAVKAIDPLGDGDKTFSTLTRYNRAFYVGTLGRIDTGFDAGVYRVSLTGARVKQVASGLHGILGLAFDTKGRMYALQTTQAGVDPPLSDPSAGSLVRINWDGSLTPLVTGLAFPSALVAGPDGAFYVTNCGYHCDDRSNFPPALTTLRAGQVLRVTIAGVSAARSED